MLFLDIILFLAYAAAFLAGVWVGGLYGGIKGMQTEAKRWIKEKVS